MQNVEFLPERIMAKRQRRICLVRQVYLLLLCVLLLLALGYTRSRRVAGAETQFQLVSQQSKNVQHQLAKLGDLQRQQAELLIKKRVDEQLGSRVSALDVLVELGRLLPDSVAVTSLDLKVVPYTLPVHFVGAGRRASATSGASNAKRSVNRVRLDLTGLAPADAVVADFIARLSASPLFEDTQMGTTKGKVVNKRMTREFTLTWYVIR